MSTIAPPPLGDIATPAEANASWSALHAVFLTKFNELFVDIARNLFRQAHWVDALDVCDRVLATEAGNHVAALLSVDILLQANRVGEAMARLIDIQGRGARPEHCAEHIQRALVAGVNAQQQHVAAGQLAEALAITESMVELRPDTPAILQSALQLAAAVGDGTRAARFTDLLAAAHNKQYEQLRAMIGYFNNAGNLDQEISCRAAVFRHPNDLQQHSALRLTNIYETLSAIFYRDHLDAPMIDLAREMIAAVEPVQDSILSATDLDAYSAHDRFLRVTLHSLALNEVVSPLDTPVQPPQWSFFDVTGHPLDTSALRAHLARLRPGAAFFAPSSPLYFKNCAATYVSSILKNADVNCLVLIGLTDPSFLPEEASAILGIDDERVLFCNERFLDGATRYNVVGPEPALHPGSIYQSSAGLISLEYFVELLQVPLILSGIDTLLQRGIADLLAEFGDHDVVLNRCEYRPRLGSWLINSLQLVFPTENSRRFGRFLRHYLGRAALAAYQPWAIDQQALVLAKQHLTHTQPTARVAYFKDYDMNNAMFNSDNVRLYQEEFRKYRFINIFKAGQADKSLSQQDISEVS